jgi:hypothetical protein
MQWSQREDTKLHFSNLNNPDRDQSLTTTNLTLKDPHSTSPDMETTHKERTDTREVEMEDTRIVTLIGLIWSMLPEINNNSSPECTLKTQEATSRWEARGMWSLKRFNLQRDTKMTLIWDPPLEISPTSRTILRLPTDSTPETETMHIRTRDPRTTKEEGTEATTNPEETSLAKLHRLKATRYPLHSWTDHHLM